MTWTACRAIRGEDTRAGWGCCKCQHYNLNERFYVDSRPTLWPIKNWKGTDPSEWPDDLRVQEFPAVGM